MAPILQGQFIWDTAIQRVYKVAANSGSRPYCEYGLKKAALHLLSQGQGGADVCAVIFFEQAQLGRIDIGQTAQSDHACAL
jgi:hypothetical protein